MFCGTNSAPFETDQKWSRPPLKKFDPSVDALSAFPGLLVCVNVSAFQQIESEEAMHNGAPCIRLFGVTDVSSPKSGEKPL